MSLAFDQWPCPSSLGISDKEKFHPDKVLWSAISTSPVVAIVMLPASICQSYLSSITKFKIIKVIISGMQRETNWPTDSWLLTEIRDEMKVQPKKEIKSIRLPDILNLKRLVFRKWSRHVQTHKIARLLGNMAISELAETISQGLISKHETKKLAKKAGWMNPIIIAADISIASTMNWIPIREVRT